MKFVVSSLGLSAGLQAVSKVIGGKSPQPILDNFLFSIRDGVFVVTASDSETTLKSNIEVAEIMEEGEIAVPARLLTESIKEFPDQPLEFRTDDERKVIEIRWLTGHSQLPMIDASEYPEIPGLNSERRILEIKSEVLLEGLSRTQYASANEDLRPIMNGVYFDMEPDMLTLVATDSHKLAYYERHDIKSAEKSSFILPKKPAAILKSILPKSDMIVKISYDSRNAYFEYENNLLVSRLIEGNYPSYRSIIPKNNNNHMIINRIGMLHAVRRVSVCANPGTSLIKLDLSMNMVNISAQDIDFSLAANEDMVCQYEGEPMQIGFKSTILIDTLSNMPYEDICVQLYDSNRAVLIKGAYNTDENEEVSALVMPMMINA